MSQTRWPAGPLKLVAACATVGLLATACSRPDDLVPFSNDVDDTLTPITAGGGDHADEVDVEPCPMDGLTVRNIGGDSAGGHSVTLFGFSTDGAACGLSEPASALVIGDDVPAPRGTFFPARPFGVVLESGERAVIAVETSSCDVDDGPHGRGLEVRFANGESVTLSLGSDRCNLGWDGFVIWK